MHWDPCKNPLGYYAISDKIYTCLCPRSFCSLPLLRMILTTLNAVNGHCDVSRVERPNLQSLLLEATSSTPTAPGRKYWSQRHSTRTYLAQQNKVREASLPFFFGRGEGGLEMEWKNGWFVFLKSFLVNIKGFSCWTRGCSIGLPRKNVIHLPRMAPKKTQEQHH